MSKSESITQKWLRQNVQTYPNPDLVYAHADAVLARHPTIRPKTDVYTYDDGRTQLLLCLHGLLPIAFRGASYNIPIAVWVPREYPRTPPVAYVVPTSDMLIRAAPDMDISGRCLIDYLRNWERKCEGCSLVALLDVMHDAFSRQPPVYAKPKDVTAQQPPLSRPSSSAPDYAARPPPPLPVERNASLPASAHGTTSPAPPPGGPPPLPAKPGPAPTGATQPPRSTSVPSSQTQLNPRSESPAILSTPAALAARPPPPLPLHGPQELAGGGHYAHSPAPPPTYSPRARGHYADLPPQAYVPGWAPGAPSSPAPPHLNQARSQQPPYRAASQTSPPAPPPPPLPPAISRGIAQADASAYRAMSPPNAYAAAPASSGPPAGSEQSYSPYAASPPYVTPQHTAGNSVGRPYVSPPPSAQPPPPPFPPTFAPPSGAPPPPPAPPSVPPRDLLDAEDDDPQRTEAPSSSSLAPAPPRPPNPELLRLHDTVHGKLAGELASLSQAMAIDAERLRAHQADLLAGAPALRDEMARLEAVRDVCRGVAARLGAVVAAGERSVAELKRKGDPEVDELVCSTTIVHNQLVNLVAEDNAIEDTIYHLHRALNAGRVDLERFLRTTRVLAEEQFMKRALIEKIQAGIPLGDATWSVPPGLR